MRVEHSTRKLQDEISSLIQATIGVNQAELCSPAFLEWKFFARRPGLGEFEGSRSSVVIGEGQIQAHACLWPLTFETLGGEVESCHVFDWVAKPQSAGTGLFVFQYLMDCKETMLAIGGSSQARRLFPKLKFQPHGFVEEFVQVVRPWRQFRIRPQGKDLRGWARLARNTLWSLQASHGEVAGWESRQVKKGSEVPERAWKVRSGRFCLGVRSAAWLDYLLDCPVMHNSLFTLMKNGVARGYFLLNQVGGQCRIIDLTVDSDHDEDWIAAYRTASAAAAKRPETCEITAISSLDWLSEGLKKLGFRWRNQVPIMLYDPMRKLSSSPPLHVRMTDNDVCLLYDERYPFLS